MKTSSARASSNKSSKTSTTNQTRKSGEEDGKRGSGSRTASKKASSADNGDALEFLKSQHREVEGLFEEFEDTDSGREQLALAQTICEKLTIHATIEEEIFYPAVQSDKTHDQLLEAFEEHLSVKRIIADLQKFKADDESLKAKVSVLKEQVSHHVDEEESELFPKVKKATEKEDRQALGERLRARGAELEGEDADDDETTQRRDGKPNSRRDGRDAPAPASLSGR